VAGAASVVPSSAVTVVSSRAVYVVPGASGALGVKVAVWLAASYATDPATVPDGPVNVKLEAVIVLGAIARENVAVSAAAVLTLVAPSVGERPVTVGAIAATVVNVQL
jgi:hypothetical protein